MLAVKKISIYGLFAVSALAIAWSGLIYATVFANVSHYLFYVFSIGFFMALAAFLIGKTGSILFFSLLGGVLLSPIPQLTNSAVNELAILFIAAFVFEAVLLFARRTVLSLVVATVFSLATMPFTMLLLVGQFYETLLKSTINFSILCFILGFFASLLALAFWEVLRTKKYIIQIRVLS